MSMPTLEPEAARLYQQIKPASEDDEANGWAAAHLCAVLMAPVEKVSRWASDDGDRPGWGIVLDVDDGPAELLPWLGQFDGTQVDPTLPEAEQRRLVREARGSHRGKRSAILSDIQAALTGTKFVSLIERAGAPLRAIVRTRPSETDETTVLAALNNRLTAPLGVVYKLIVADIWIVAEIERTYSTVHEFEEAFATVKAVEEHEVI